MRSGWLAALPAKGHVAHFGMLGFQIEQASLVSLPLSSGLKNVRTRVCAPLFAWLFELIPCFRARLECDSCSAIVVLQPSTVLDAYATVCFGWAPRMAKVACATRVFIRYICFCRGCKQPSPRISFAGNPHCREVARGYSGSGFPPHFQFC